MLTLERVVARYGRMTALDGVTLTVGASELVCLIGANGAGKTTTLKTISGLIIPAEPSLGLAPTVVEAVFAIIAAIQREGTTVLMVEQNAYMALQLAVRAYVMETGRVTLEGPARELARNAHVRRAYLGG